jgi:hypothetical protein
LIRKDAATQVEPHFTLAEAVERFFPGGGITVRSLRTEIKEGRLSVIEVAGKFLVSERALAEMLEKCRCHVADKRHDSTCGSADLHAAMSGRSETERLELARVAASTILNARKKLSRVT